MNENKLNTKSLWDSDICKQTDEDRKKNPEKYIENDRKISNMLDHITRHSCINEQIQGEDIMNNIRNKNILIDNLTTRQLGILQRVYGKDWVKLSASREG